MKIKNLFSLLLLMLAVLPVTAKKKTEPAMVIITAGQSNTDGRVLNTQLPDYIQQNKYKHCYWSYGTGGKYLAGGNGKFELFWPKMGHQTRPGRWAYDAVTYYLLDQKARNDFYVIKWSVGGTAIDTTCTSTSRKYWTADPVWLSHNKSTLQGGRSLLKSLTEEIDACIDNTLSKLPQGYRFKAMLWHQGESDYRAGARYYDNLKAVVAYVRQHLAEKTGNKAYLHLPFICGTVSRLNKCYNKDVEEALHRLAREDRNFHVIDMSAGELQKDRLHFTAPAAEHLGTEMYKVLESLK